jgi:hypothetical protein
MLQLNNFKSIKEVLWRPVENVTTQMLLGMAHGSSVQAAVKCMKGKVISLSLLRGAIV